MLTTEQARDMLEDTTRDFLEANEKLKADPRGGKASVEGWTLLSEGYSQILYTGHLLDCMANEPSPQARQGLGYNIMHTLSKVQMTIASVHAGFAWTEEYPQAAPAFFRYN